jgi:hypothetical protein
VLPQSADRFSVAISVLLELRHEALNPSQERRMRNIHAALAHHLDQVSIAKFVSEISAGTEDDDCGIKVAANGE